GRRRCRGGGKVHGAGRGDRSRDPGYGSAAAGGTRDALSPPPLRSGREHPARQRILRRRAAAGDDGSGGSRLSEKALFRRGDSPACPRRPGPRQTGEEAARDARRKARRRPGPAGPQALARARTDSAIIGGMPASSTAEILQKTLSGERLSAADAVTLLEEGELLALGAAADEVRRRR